jgi:hypothetical protein
LLMPTPDHADSKATMATIFQIYHLNDMCKAPGHRGFLHSPKVSPATLTLSSRKRLGFVIQG